jgi:hypothetical protein
VITPEERKEEFDEQASEEGLKSAKALVQSFLQTVKGYRLYEANHPILKKFLERLENDFDRYFKDYPAFALQVGEHQLLYHGNVVYESISLPCSGKKISLTSPSPPLMNSWRREGCSSPPQKKI